MIADIDSSSREQAEGAKQIAKAVDEIDKIVQHNAAGAEQLSAACRDVSSQTDELRNYIGELWALVGRANGNNHRTGSEEREKALADEGSEMMTYRQLPLRTEEGF